MSWNGELIFPENEEEARDEMALVRITNLEPLKRVRVSGERKDSSENWSPVSIEIELATDESTEQLVRIDYQRLVVTEIE